MIRVFATIFFNFICIGIFCIIYLYLKDEFINNNALKNNALKNNDIDIMDFILFSTTIQAGVGITSLSPNSFSTKLVATIQQIIMITSYFFVLHFFVN